MKTKCAVLLGVWLLVLSSVFSQTQLWTNLVIKKVQFEDASFSDVCTFLSNQVQAVYPDVHLEFKFDGYTPDRRLPSWKPEQVRPVTLGLRNVPCIDFLKYVCTLANTPRFQIEGNVIRFCDTRSGRLVVPSRFKFDAGIGIYSGLDRPINLQTNTLTVTELLAWIPSATVSEIILDPAIIETANRATVTLPSNELSAFDLLRVSVETLRRQLRQEITLYRPTSTASLYRKNMTGAALGIGLKSAGFQDVRSVFPYFEREIKKGDETDYVQWRPQDSESGIQEMLKRAKDMVGISDLFYEPTLNAFWAVSDHFMWFDYYDGGPIYLMDSKPREFLRVKFDEKGNLVIQPVTSTKK